MLERLELLLWEEWDPIGLNDMEDAMGENDSYASNVLALLNEGKTHADILAYLEWVETEYIGLGFSGKSPRVVDRIFEIHEGNQLMIGHDKKTDGAPPKTPSLP